MGSFGEAVKAATISGLRRERSAALERARRCLCLWQALEGLALRRRTTVNAIVREASEAITNGAVQPDPEIVAKYGPR